MCEVSILVSLKIFPSYLVGRDRVIIVWWCVGDLRGGSTQLVFCPGANHLISWPASSAEMMEPHTATTIHSQFLWHSHDWKFLEIALWYSMDWALLLLHDDDDDNNNSIVSKYQDERCHLIEKLDTSLTTTYLSSYLGTVFGTAKFLFKSVDYFMYSSFDQFWYNWSRNQTQFLITTYHYLL